METELLAEKLLGRALECECGKTHRIDPRELLYADDAVARFPAVCERHCRGRRASVLTDVRTREAAGADVARALAGAGWRVREVLVEDRPGGLSPVCDEATRRRVGELIGQADLVVSVGAGVISDLGKWIAFEMDLPAATFATAASMNGYAAANVASAAEGVKVMIRARPPLAVASSPSVLCGAPRELAAAGLGDVLARSVSSADWRVNSLIFGDYYCPRAVALVAEIEPLYIEHPEAIRECEPWAVTALFDALLLTGIGMTMAETSDPASGAEHLVSHPRDRLAAGGGTEHDLHGRQVGVGTILAAELYRLVLAVESPRPVAPGGGVDRAFWGPLGDAVAGHYRGKVPRLAAAAEWLSRGGNWDTLREEISPMVRDPGTIRDCLRRAGGAWRAEDLGVGRDRMRQVLSRAHEMRGRFTVLDLAILLGVMPAAAERIVDEWA